MPSARNRSAGPSPERQSSDGVWIDPALSTTSLARTVCSWPLRSTVTPVAHPPSVSTRSTRVPDHTERLRRWRAPSRYVSAVDIRRPPDRFMGKGPTPVDEGSLWSATHGIPWAMQPERKATCRSTNSSSCQRTMGTGPSSPWRPEVAP